MSDEQKPKRQITTVARGAGGKWLPGTSPNPGGRPKSAHVRELAQEYTQEAIAVLVDALKDADGRVRISAANSLLDRAWGKPVSADEAEKQEADRLASMTEEQLWEIASQGKAS